MNRIPNRIRIDGRDYFNIVNYDEEAFFIPTEPNQDEFFNGADLIAICVADPDIFYQKNVTDAITTRKGFVQRPTRELPHFDVNYWIMPEKVSYNKAEIVLDNGRWYNKALTGEEEGDPTLTDTIAWLPPVISYDLNKKKADKFEEEFATTEWTMELI